MSEESKKPEKPKLSDYIGDPEALFGYLQDTATKHEHYRYYSSQKTIEKILENNSLVLSFGCNWNDLEDQKAFSSSMPGYKRFGICMSFSDSENIAMWMLYGGIDGKGAMLDLTKAMMNRTIEESGEIELGYLDGRSFHLVQNVVPSEYRLYMLDVLYVASNRDGYKAKRGQSMAEKLSILPSGRGVLVKSYPWSYENEVRIVLEVPERLVEGNVRVARLPISVAQGKLSERVYLSPTNDDQRYNRSMLSGKVHWDLCANCESRKD